MCKNNPYRAPNLEERGSYSECLPSRAKRASVVGPGMLFFLLVMVKPAARSFTGDDAIVAWLSSVMGPLAFFGPSPFVMTNPLAAFALSVVVMAIVVVHPLWPSCATAIISACGIALWFFIGLSLTYSGV